MVRMAAAFETENLFTAHAAFEAEIPSTLCIMPHVAL